MEIKKEKSVFQTIRVRKEDSVFIYFILESYEGMTSYSTLDFQTGDPDRLLELRTPRGFLTEVQTLLEQLQPWILEVCEPQG